MSSYTLTATVPFCSVGLHTKYTSDERMSAPHSVPFVKSWNGASGPHWREAARLMSESAGALARQPLNVPMSYSRIGGRPT